MTPLQLYIAGAIIQREHISNYLLLNFNPHDRPVLQNYFARTAAKALHADYVIVNARFFENLRRVRDVLKRWKKYRIDRIYFASLDTVFVQYFIHHLPSAALVTFDDGAVNIVPTGDFHIKAPLGLRQRVAYFFLRRNKDQNWIRARVRMHWTLFKGFPNIVDQSKVSVLNLFDLESAAGTDKYVEARTVRVFLGFSLSLHYRSAVLGFRPDIYLPHPMEPSANWPFLVEKTDLIAEEYLANLLKSGVSVDCYACNSTTLLNVAHPRLRKFVVSLDDSIFQASYNTIAAQLGCKILLRQASPPSG